MFENNINAQKSTYYGRRDHYYRLLIIRTLPYSRMEVEQILRLRALTEGIQVVEEALSLLGEVGTRTTLRYAAQLLTPSALTAKVNGRNTIAKADVQEIGYLFLDENFTSEWSKSSTEKD
ncbi:hypothetical protein C0J52_23440 [Blattella germanica]|nr:hypothetical protein C0J52_23440 [Blattella germanica]